MSEAALSTSGIGARFGGLQALNDVTVTVERDTIVSIIGPNGAGKSTLLNAVNRLIRTVGAVHVFGADVTRERAFNVSRHGVARTFQDPQLVDSETVLENVLSGTFPARSYSTLDQIVRRGRVGGSENAAATRAMELLAMVGLDGQATRRCSELAYGPRKLIDILRALICAPRLILLDEPSSGLDTHERHRVRDLLKTIHAQGHPNGGGVSMLVVEHHMDLVRAISHKVIALQSGAVLMQGETRAVLESQGFRQAMIGGA
ncbi:MAG: ATP-binding cassette domain-containing protein [Rhizobiaceae bacterium]